MTKRLECVADTDGEVLAGKSTTIVLSGLDLRFLLGLLNSKLVNFYYGTTFGGNKLAGGYLRVGPPQIRTIPIPVFEGTHRVAAAKQERIVKLVERMLALNTQIDAAKTPTDKTAIQRQIDATDQQIDQLVYELYELSDDEIKIVEEATSK